MTYASLDVDANVVKQNGLLGMAVGEKISAPMTILFSDTQDLSGNVWFVDFDPTVKGKNPCKNKSNFVTAERSSDTSWEITFGASSIACLKLNDQLLGTYLMPFQFTVVQK
jgi:xanthosine utilization system XapX-like protein